MVCTDSTILKAILRQWNEVMFLQKALHLEMEQKIFYNLNIRVMVIY